MAYIPSAPELPELYAQQTSEDGRYCYVYPDRNWSQSTQQVMKPDVVRSFYSADIHRSGFLDEAKLRQALSFFGYRGISAKTIRFLMFIYKSPGDPLLRLGRKEYAELCNSLAQWHEIFDRYDRDRSAKMNSIELRDALYHLGYMVPTTVLQLIISQYNGGTGKTVDLCFDRFLELGMIVKGLTEKFKEKDPGYTGSATLPYDVFMLMVIPFIASND